MQAVRQKKDWCRDPLPIGTIRVHAGTRRIKVSMREPKSRQWMDYARWWWLKNRGPVPEGKRVAHADGDMLNDDPANLILALPGDIAFLWHDRDPAGSKRNYAKCRKATAEFNRMSAQIRREREWLPSYWYAVDLKNRVVINQPRRKRHEVYRVCGLVGEASLNGHGLEAAVLGWPALPSLCAMVLATLIETPYPGWLNSLRLHDRVNAMRADFGLSPISRGSLTSANTILRAGDLLLTHNGGMHVSSYHVGKRAVAERENPLGVVAVKGRDLSQEKYAGFTRSTNGVFDTSAIHEAATTFPRKPKPVYVEDRRVAEGGGKDRTAPETQRDADFHEAAAIDPLPSPRLLPGLPAGEMRV